MGTRGGCGFVQTVGEMCAIKMSAWIWESKSWQEQQDPGESSETQVQVSAQCEEREDEELWLQRNQAHQTQSYDGGGGLSADADHGWSELWLLVWMGEDYESATKLNHYT